MADQVEDHGKALKEKSMAEFAEKTKGKPTPTQDENDRAARGEHITEHEPDGSPVEETSALTMDHQRVKQAQAKPGGAPYQTRQATPTPPPKPAG